MRCLLFLYYCSVLPNITESGIRDSFFALVSIKKIRTNGFMGWVLSGVILVNCITEVSAYWFLVRRERFFLYLIAHE